MKKNVAGQKVGAQMITAADGSPFTGAVTVAVTLDAGTQATGTVGSGACTHEGGGYHTYAPAQAETNGDLAAFTFSGTGAISTTLQIYTSFPQTADHAAGIADLPTNAELATALGTADDAVLVAIDALPTAAENADALLGRSIQGGADGGRTVTSALRAIRNRRGIVAGTATFYEEDDTTPAWTAAVTTTAGDPISDLNPT